MQWLSASGSIVADVDGGSLRWKQAARLNLQRIVHSGQHVFAHARAAASEVVMATLALCGVGVPQAGGGARVPATFSEFMSIPAFRGLLEFLATMTVADLWPTGEELLSHRTGDEPLSSDVG